MFSLRLVGFSDRRAPLWAAWRTVTTEMHWTLSRHYSRCWILSTAQRPLPLPPLQEPRKQSDDAAAAILLGRGSGKRIGASSLFLFPSSIGYRLLSADSYWLRKFTFFGGLLLRRSTSFDLLHLFVGVPISPIDLKTLLTILILFLKCFVIHPLLLIYWQNNNINSHLLRIYYMPNTILIFIRVISCNSYILWGRQLLVTYIFRMRKPWHKDPQ